MSAVVIRPAIPADLPDLRSAMVELQEHERRLNATTRLPGEQVADAYLTRLQQEVAEKRGAIFVVAERAGVFAGFAIGWIVERDHIPESADSNRFGYLSDICVMPAYRRQRIAQQLLEAVERHFASHGITRFRLFTLAANASARAAYESAGFAPYEILYEKLVDRPETVCP
jgi:ribosomal protein S18 acetylase RimI-like enzyme